MRPPPPPGAAAPKTPTNCASEELSLLRLAPRSARSLCEPQSIGLGACVKLPQVHGGAELQCRVLLRCLHSSWGTGSSSAAGPGTLSPACPPVAAAAAGTPPPDRLVPLPPPADLTHTPSHGLPHLHRHRHRGQRPCSGCSSSGGSRRQGGSRQGECQSGGGSGSPGSCRGRQISLCAACRADPEGRAAQAPG